MTIKAKRMYDRKLLALNLLSRIFPIQIPFSSLDLLKVDRSASPAMSARASMSGTIYLGANEYSVGEADDYALVSIKRSGDSSGAVTIKYATNPGTATQGS